ncbi:MAG TPA: efflux RND transporter permease subunit, partial [Candidatus Hydrogenedentes bacterium]|nr:efflux RND transporter permease subunit [Candidatus Hydrogenedentota bacterium]
AVTISVAKRKGSNAITIADHVIEKVRALQGTVIPSDIQITVSRNYGETAQEKSNELLYHMFLAVVSVAILIAFVLGVRESGTVAIAIPVTLALTLVVFYFYGYTLNRVTLFALIFSIGILVDDAIVVVENIVRHYHLPENKGRPVIEIAVDAVDEVGNPTLLATAAVIAAILPMAFVRGLMGPYMAPIPVGASAAMIFSVIVSFMVTPWAAYRLLRAETPHKPKRSWFRRMQRTAGTPSLPPESDIAMRTAETPSHAHSEGALDRLYRRVMDPLIHRPILRYGFLVMVSLLLLAACSLVPLSKVLVKMLPFDNKSEFQVIIDMPEGTTLEQTATATRAIADYLRTVPEVANMQTYVGTASPHNFNGLVRHYFLRSNPNEADIQVNLAPKEARAAQSHDIAKRVRPGIQAVAERFGARVKVAEVPPGPPVLQTLVAEVYGPTYERQIEVARKVREIFEQTEGVVDTDWYVEDDQTKIHFDIDQEKAALNGISVEQAGLTLRTALEGTGVGLIHQPKEKEDVAIMLRLDRAHRSSVEDLKAIKVAGDKG